MELEKKNFIRIINENRGTIRSLCKCYYHSSEDQKDAFQDIILQLWKSFDSFSGSSKVNTWIYRVSLNTLLTKIRKDKKSIVAESIDKLHHYISNANADDQIELLSIIIQSLNEIDKAIVILYLEGYRNKEIAEMLNLSATNVSTRFNRIKTALRKKLDKNPHAIK